MHAQLGVDMLKLVGGAFSGSLQGKALSGFVRMGLGVQLVPGRYRLLLPVDDPIYGTVVLAVPEGRAPLGHTYVIQNTLVSSYAQVGLPDSSFALSERQLPGVPTLIVYNGHAGLGAAAREAAGRGELTVV